MRLITVIGFILILGGGVVSQDIYTSRHNSARPKFNTDFAEFKADSIAKNNVELYYRVYNSDILFVRDGDNFRGDYELNFTVYDRKDRPLDSKTIRKQIITPDYFRTLSARDYRIGQMDFSLPPDKYKVVGILTDLNAKRDISREMKLDLTRYDNRNPQLSGIQFLHTFDSAATDAVFYKDGMTLIPDVARVYGGDTTSVLKAYFEVYQGKDSLDEIQMHIEINDSRLNLAYQSDTTVFLNSGVSRHLKVVPFRDLKAGEYSLSVYLRSRRGRDVDKVQGDFRVYWSPQAMILNDPESAVEMLKYIASNKELDNIRKAPDAQARLRQWQAFWEAKDPTPGTPENEAREDYYRRVEFATDNFSIMRKEGWRTDRGMVYITYGSPDQIEDHPFELENKAYQIWYYYHSGNQVREFLFVDDWGNNDFVLQYPYDGIRH